MYKREAPEGYEWRAVKVQPVRDGVHNAVERVKSWVISRRTGREHPPIISYRMKRVLRRKRT